MLAEGGISDEKIEIDSWRYVFRMKILKKSNVLPEGGISIEKIGFFSIFSLEKHTSSFAFCSGRATQRVFKVKK